MSQGEAELAAAARRQAQRTLNHLVVYVCFASALLVVMAVGLAASPEEPRYRNPQKGAEIDSLRKQLLVLLFFAATIVNLGICWSGRILSARRFHRSDPRRAARTLVVSQWMCFAVYGLFALAVFYYRMAAAGDRAILIAATLGAGLASFYFLKVPGYLLSAIFVQPGRPDDRQGPKVEDDSARD